MTTSQVSGSTRRQAVLGELPRTLPIDDERDLSDLMRMALRHQGRGVSVAHSATDVVVLDVELPDMDGLAVLEQRRDSSGYTSIVFLTARDAAAGRAAGIDELVARLGGLLRRSAQLTPAGDEVLVVGDLELDGASRAVTRAGSSISLTSTEFELLRYLMRHQGRAVSRKEILARVWNYDFGGRSGIVDLYVSYLRKKVDAGRAPMIHTVRGVGYLLRSAE
jgi:two-component system response regulator TrcR